MSKRVARCAVGLVALLAAFWGLFTLAMRAKFRPVQDAVRRMNRAVVNPRQMETAGRPGAYASVVRHRGRTTGTPYETPVQALPTGDGFVIPLPYGTASDWLKNVLAAGSATIVHEGGTYRVDRPEIVSGAVAERHVPPRHLRAHRWYGMNEYLQVRTAEAEEQGRETA